MRLAEKLSACRILTNCKNLILYLSYISKTLTSYIFGKRIVTSNNSESFNKTVWKRASLSVNTILEEILWIRKR
ncbi:MAG: hypothetical protein PWQ22_1028 [Archaeoglobaceae archaeon]|nr:hypothetical protein [Archaeoglobaceae archaeon]MDK2876618.1 hypothetical protein [Archaeoglobaceae archaeon]